MAPVVWLLLLLKLGEAVQLLVPLAVAVLLGVVLSDSEGVPVPLNEPVPLGEGLGVPVREALPVSLVLLLALALRGRREWAWKRGRGVERNA